MFNLSRLLRAIERRARRLRGLRRAGIAFSVVGVAPVGIAVCCRLNLLSLSWPVLGGVLALPFLVALFAYFLVRRPKVSLPRLLLRIDQALGTSERLSSLYELRQRGGGGVFRRRIEKHLQDRRLPWKKGLPVGLTCLIPFATGALILVGAYLVIAFAPSPSADLAESLRAEPPVAAEKRTAALTPEQAVPAPPEEAGPPLESTPPEAGTSPPDNFEDVLSEIWDTPATGGALVQGGEDLSGLIEEQRTLSQAIEELLSRLQEQQTQEEVGLTEQQRRALSELVSGVTSPQLRQALESLLEETDPEALRDQVEQALGLIRMSARSDGDQSAEQQERIRPTPEDVKESEAAFGWTPTEVPEEGTNADGGKKPQRSATGDDTGDTSSGQDQPWGREEDLDPYGGTKGAEGQGTSQEEQAGFIPTDLAATIGSTGGFQEFLTKGVPMEPGALQAGEVERYVINYETLRAILQGRSIPPEAREVVRQYFETITQGGP